MPRSVLLVLGLVISPALAWASAGGPDGSGYTWADQNEPGTVTSIPATTGAGTTIAFSSDDAVSLPVPLGFAFPFHGTTTSDIVVSSNGWLSFDTTLVDSHPASQPMPRLAAPNSLVAFYWRDLDRPTTAVLFPIAGGRMLFWRAREAGGGAQAEVFLALFDSGIIRAIYVAAGSPAGVSLGIEGPAGDPGLGVMSAGSGEDGFVLASGTVIEYYPPPRLVCGAAAGIACGDTIPAASPAPLADNVTAYRCRPGVAYLGNEKVFDFTVASLSSVTLALGNVTPGRELDLFLLRRGLCNEFQCLAWGDSAIAAPYLEPGTYRVVVDGPGPADDGTFEIAAACQDRVQALACQQPGDPPVAGLTSGTGAFNNYSCSNQDLNGPEQIYQLRFTPPGNIKATLAPVSPGVDLDLLLFGPDDFDPAGCAAWGEDGVTAFDPAPGVYWLVVDGKDNGGTTGNSGAFDLTVTCEVLLDCLPQGDLSCGVETFGDTASGASRAIEYSCTTDEFAGREVVYRFHNDVDRTVGFLLEGAADVGLFLLPQGNCNEGACIEHGRGRLVAKNLPAGDYYLVADAAGAGGRFSLLPVCEHVLTPESLSIDLPAGAAVHETKELLINADVSRGDVVFAMDLTGSMSSLLPQVKNTANAIIAELSTVIDDVEFGLASFEDYPGNHSACGYAAAYGAAFDRPYRLDLPITNDQALLESTILGLGAGNGGDGPESYLRVLYEMYADAANIAWRPDARKIVVMFGDNQPHVCDRSPCVPGGGGTGIDPGRDGVAGTADDLDMTVVQAELLRQGITPIFIDAGPGAVAAEWDCWNRLGGGTAYAAPGGSLPPTLVEDLRIRIEEKALLCSRLEPRANPQSFGSWLSQVTPPWLSTALPARVYFDFDVGPPAGTPPGVHDFAIDMVCDGAVRASQQVHIEVFACTPPAGQVGNRLMVTRAGEDLVLDWSGGALSPPIYNLHRLGAKEGLRPPRLDPPLDPVTASEGTVVAGGVGLAPDLALYDVWGRDCAGGTIFP